MARRRNRKRRVSRRVLETRAPKKGTAVIASVFYIVGLFGYLDLLPFAVHTDIAVIALAIAGGLLLLGALLRDL